MGNPVSTLVEGGSCQATLVYEGTKSKIVPENVLKLDVT
jgi:hypothetical protein